ncbi:hypothetical protein P154DRAFT_47266 [Amniculicola lignicola CBS 123094]|uniref:Uncharacterized protein n=1 Tax=Amniculicola lignicola CBS 123094 TaxID=1392246 RepID=A0A6A5VYA7_9PLEO|nr:hypothetical protein P154DRAFT_47266 [Amniculicola lignicola CBS 123094]
MESIPAPLLEGNDAPKTRSKTDRISQQGIFFGLLPRELRNIIYAQLDLYPFSCSRDYEGMYLSCRQARFEMEEETSFKLRELLNTCLDDFERCGQLPRPAILNFEDGYRKRNLDIEINTDRILTKGEIDALSPLMSLNFDAIRLHFEACRSDVIGDSYGFVIARRAHWAFRRYCVEKIPSSEDHTTTPESWCGFKTLINIKQLCVMWDFTISAHATPAEVEGKRDQLLDSVQRELEPQPDDRLRYRQVGTGRCGALILRCLHRWSSLPNDGWMTAYTTYVTPM